MELFCECVITIWFTGCEQMAVATITLHSTASANIILQMFKFEYRNDNVVIMINIAHQSKLCNSKAFLLKGEVTDRQTFHLEQNLTKIIATQTLSPNA